MDSRLIQSASYHTSPKAREFEKQEIDQVLAMDVIEPTQTEWALPIDFVEMKDRKLRFYAFYRKLNAFKI